MDPGDNAIEIQRKGSGQRIAAGSINVSKVVRIADPNRRSTGRILLRIAPGTTPRDVAIESDTFTAVAPYLTSAARASHWFEVSVPTGAESARLDAYAAMGAVEVAQEAGIGSEGMSTNDTHYVDGTQYNVQKTRLTAAWEVRRLASTHPIAIIDSGVSANHQDLPALLQNRDFTGTGVAPCDDHASNVASIAGAASNNGNGTAGGAWGGPLGSYKVLSGAGCGGTDVQLINGIDNAFHDGFWILNMSLQDYPLEVAIQNVITAAWNAGRFVVGIAGNHGTDALNYPGAYDHVFAVANSDNQDARWNGANASNYGNWVDLAAPGVGIVGAGAACATCESTFWGTSQAAPLVSAAAALLMEGGMPNTNIAAALQASADPINWGATPIGGGRLNAYKAITSRACLRDLPGGSAVASTSAIYSMQNGSKRAFPDPATFSSWYGTESAATCDVRLGERPNGAAASFKPGTLIKSPGGTIYLVTGTGADIFRSTIRGFTSTAVYNCLGFTNLPVVNTTDAIIALHPVGSVISNCTVGLPRKHPDGSILRDANGTIFMVDGGLLRGFSSLTMLTSWGFSNSIPITAVEKLTYATTSNMGYRPGSKAIAPNGVIWILGFGSTDHYLAVRRAFTTLNSLTERYLAGTTYSATNAELAGNAVSASILDADAMP
ncbi:MAG: thermitase [Actinomycetota bacterium]